MAIRKNHQKFIQKSQPVTNSLDEGEKATVEISEANIKSQQALDKLRRQKIGYPDTEILEAGAVEQWLEERKLQLIEDASQTRNHSGFAQSFGVAVVVTGFAMSGGTMAALSPIIIGLGAIGYCTSLVDTKARINKIFPVPFLNLSPGKLVHRLSPDLREMQSDLPEEYDKLNFLPFDKARELLMLTDYQNTKLQTIHAPRVDHQDTKIQAAQDEIELVFQKLIDAPTTDIKEAIRSTNPGISDNALDKVIFKIRSEAIARNNQALLSKFF
jgi:hypothetical protein